MRGKSISLLSVLALLTVLAIAAIWTQMVPQYQARGEVRVRPVIPVLVFKTEDNGPIPLYESFVNTQVSVMRSPMVLQRVLDQQEIRQTQWCKNARRSLKQRLLGNQAAPPVERLRDTLSVRPRRGTEIIDVSFLDRNAEDAKIIVDAVLERYIDYVGEKSDATKDELYRLLVNQYKSLEQDIEGLESITAKISESLGTTTPQELVSAKRDRLDQAKVRLSEFEQIIAVLQWEIKQANALDSNEAVGDAADSHGATGLPITVAGPNGLDATGLPVAIAGASNLSGEEKLAFLEHQLARTIQQRDLLKTDLDTQKTDFKEFCTIARMLEKENKKLKHKSELFSAVRQRLDQKNMERQVSGPIEVLSRALAPSEPYNDRRILFTAIALGLCLVLGSGIVFLQRTRMGDGGKGRRQ
ncbi:MAG: hypothetical protein ISS70_22915 [Phycisphaerae bacterium]|nr:hypothetical protein [Phycisphaerae bacterium]